MTSKKLEVVEVTQTEEGQRQKLKIVLDFIQQILGLGRWSGQQKWTVESKEFFYKYLFSINFEMLAVLFFITAFSGNILHLFSY